MVIQELSRDQPRLASRSQEIRDTTGKLILNILEILQQVSPSPTALDCVSWWSSTLYNFTVSTYNMAAATAPMKSNSGNNAFKVLQNRYIEKL